MYCEDHPACGHTSLDPCERQPYDEPGYFDTSRPGNEHALCEHEAGLCDVDMDDERDRDEEEYNEHLLDEERDEAREEYQAHTPPDDEDGPDGIDDRHMTGADYHAYLLAQEGPRE